MRKLLTRTTAKRTKAKRADRKVTRAEIKSLFASELDARFRRPEAA